MSEFTSQPSSVHYQEHDINKRLRRYGADIEVGRGSNEQGERFVRLFDPRTGESKDVLEDDLVSSARSQQERPTPAEVTSPPVEEEQRVEKRSSILKRLAKKVVGTVGSEVVSSPYDAVDAEGNRLYTRLTVLGENGEQKVRYLRND